MTFPDKILWLCSVFIMLPACSQTDVATDFDQQVQEHMQQGHMPGLAIAIVDENGLRWGKGYGYADVANQTPMTVDTVMPIASISKTFIGTSMVFAIEEGVLDLDRDINDYLPFKVDNPHFSGEVITSRNLATHTSGINDEEDFYDGPVSYYQGGDNPIVLGDFLRDYFTPGAAYYSAEGNYNKNLPGEKFTYSNIGAGLMAHVLENVTHTPFNIYTKQKIFDPLGMTSTGWFYSEIDKVRHAELYKYEEGEFVAHAPYGLATWPDGGVRTTVRDLSRYLAAVMNGGQFEGKAFLSGDQVKSMLEVQPFGGHGDRKYGLFWTSRVFTDYLLIGHTGGDPGVSTIMYFDPARHIGIIAFTNGDGEGAHLAQLVEAALSSADQLVSGQ